MSGSTSNTYNNSGDAPQGMTTGEMLELAAVDALGLLDDAEREAFDAAFRRAPSAVRELVRAEQARVAELGLALPDVDAPDALREKVLAKVRAEIERSKAAGVAGSVPAGGRATVHAGGGRPEPRSLGIRHPRRVSSVWRVAAIGASVAAVVLAVVQVQLRQEITDLNSRSETAALLDALGLEHVDDLLFADASVQRVRFVPVGDVGRAEATLIRNPDHDRSRLYVKNLASRADYTVVALDASGAVVSEVARFESDDLLTSVDLRLPGNPGETVRIAILSSGENPETLFIAEILLA